MQQIQQSNAAILDSEITLRSTCAEKQEQLGAYMKTLAHVDESRNSLKQMQVTLNPEGSQESLSIADNMMRLQEKLDSDHDRLDSWCNMYRLVGGGGGGRIDHYKGH